MCNTNDNLIMYGSWDIIECDWQIFLSFWIIFCPFTYPPSPHSPPPPLTTSNFKILKKLRKYLEILSLYTCVPWITITWSVVPGLDKFNICVHSFSCTKNISACKFVHAKLPVHETVTVGANLHRLICNLLIIVIVFPTHLVIS